MFKNTSFLASECANNVALCVHCDWTCLMFTFFHSFCGIVQFVFSTHLFQFVSCSIEVVSLLFNEFRFEFQYLVCYCLVWCCLRQNFLLIHKLTGLLMSKSITYIDVPFHASLSLPLDNVWITFQLNHYYQSGIKRD